MTLTLNTQAFKRAFAARLTETTYQRVHRRAHEHQQAKWAAYEPLSRQQLFDSFIDEPPHVILGPTDFSSPARSTLNGSLHSQVLTQLRPTEGLAILHALGKFKFAEEDPVERLGEPRPARWCIGCKTAKSLEAFDRDARNPSGWAFRCKRCRLEAAPPVFRRAVFAPRPHVSAHLIPHY